MRLDEMELSQHSHAAPATERPRKRLRLAMQEHERQLDGSSGSDPEVQPGVASDRNAPEQRDANGDDLGRGECQPEPSKPKQVDEETSREDHQPNGDTVERDTVQAQSLMALVLAPEPQEDLEMLLSREVEDFLSKGGEELDSHTAKFWRDCASEDQLTQLDAQSGWSRCEENKHFLVTMPDGYASLEVSDTATCLKCHRVRDMVHANMVAHN